MIKIGTTDTGGHIVILNDEEIAKLETTDQPQTAVFLPYKHVSQKGKGAAKNVNDCGAACVVSVARESGYPDLQVDDVAERYQQPNEAMQIWRVMNALKGYGIGSAYKRPLHAVEIADYIENGRFVIALVDYQRLPHKFINYNVAHYILMYGVDGDALYYHDPLGDGRELTITLDQMDRALVSSGGLPYQGIVQNTTS